jgi:hypothetical protein
MREEVRLFPADYRDERVLEKLRQDYTINQDFLLIPLS